MKILSMVIASVVLILAAGPVLGGYRDLKREMDAYAPPALLRQAQVSRPSINGEPDAFEAEAEAIAKLRDHWEKVLGETLTVTGVADIQPAVIEAAADDAQTLDLLRPRFFPPDGPSPDPVAQSFR